MITFDTYKLSTSHSLNGVGILTLNETCKAYANRDIWISGELNYQEEYQDFIPNSTITESDYLVSNSSYIIIMEFNTLEKWDEWLKQYSTLYYINTGGRKYK